jgi:hypothetical protein
MSFINKLKSKIKEQGELVPAYKVSAKLEFPIYSFDTTDELDPNVIKDICLNLMEDSSNQNTTRLDGLKNGWASPYYEISKDKNYFEMFYPLINLIENKANKILIHKVNVSLFWFQVYGKGTEQFWHHHAGDEFPLIKDLSYSGVYYPAATDNVSPIEFSNLGSDNLSLSVKSGQLLFFPKALQHYVPPNTNDNLRIALGFGLGYESLV